MAFRDLTIRQNDKQKANQRIGEKALSNEEAVLAAALAVGRARSDDRGAKSPSVGTPSRSRDGILQKELAALGEALPELDYGPLNSWFDNHRLPVLSSEHRVASDDNWIIVKMAQVDATAATDLDGPSVFAYLSDLHLLNCYGAGIELEAWSRSPAGSVYVIHSMPFYQGPYPTLDQIERFHREFDEVPGDGPHTFVQAEGFDLDIWDAKPPNYIDDQTLGVVPIDLHFMFDSFENRKEYMEAYWVTYSNGSPNE